MVWPLPSLQTVLTTANTSEFTVVGLHLTLSSSLLPPTILSPFFLTQYSDPCFISVPED